MYILCKPILSAGRMGGRTLTLRSMMSSYPTMARSYRSGIPSYDLEKLFIGNSLYRDFLRADHSTLLDHLAKEGQSE